jgi:phospholipase C
MAGAIGTVAGAPGTAGASAPPSPIKHIVVLYLENHSFDSLLGFWCDDNPGRCPQGGMPSTVRLSNGAVVTPSDMPDVPPIVAHTVHGQQEAIDGGKMDGWQLVVGCHPPHYKCISGLEPSQEPNLITLADQFAISDDYFSLANSPSWGGHVYAVTASLDNFLGDIPVSRPHKKSGPGWGCDSLKVTQWVPSGGGPLQMVPSCIPDPSLHKPHGGAFRKTPVPQVPSIMDRLSAAGLSWTSYAATVGKPGYIWSVCASLASCLDTSESSNVHPDSRIIKDARAGTLPAFSIITPGDSDVANSWHNGDSTTAGDNWLGKIAGAIMTGPEWSSTALFVTWDDCGCFYDQVPPPPAPNGRPEGPRLPLLIVSPYARHAYTDTTRATHASILAYTERTFGLAPLNVNDLRAYEFGNAFNYSQPPLKPVHMVTRPIPRGDHIIWSQNNQDT